MRPFCEVATALVIALALSALWPAAAQASQPKFVTYVDRILNWWPPEQLARDIGIPPYAPPNAYTHFNLAFWTDGGAADVVDVWSDPLHYVSSDNPWGATNDAIQQKWADLFHQAGKKVLISAFGSTDFPTTAGKDPTATCTKLGQFVATNHLDGVDLDWEDDSAMDAGTGEAWLIACTKALRGVLPQGKYIISHAPQAPYFTGRPTYKNNGYLAVNAEVGSLIDFYNIQFYNQGTSKYSSYDSLFVASDGWASNTSVLQMAANGVAPEKLVIGKPVTSGDATNTGYMALPDLATALRQGVATGKWRAGFMGWQFASDIQTPGNWSVTLAASFGK